MAAFDFPASPTPEQIFTPPGGPTFKWNGYGWAQIGTSTSDGIADAPDSQNYVRTLGAWVLGYTKAALDTLLGGKVAKSGDTMTGNLTIEQSGAANAQLFIYAHDTNHAVLALNSDNAGLNSSNQIFSLSGGLPRWVMQIGNYEEETGGNAGSNFAILRHSDAGAGLAWCFNINRATGVVGMPEGATTSKMTVNGPDLATNLLVAGATKGIRFIFDGTQAGIHGMDNTGAASFQPLTLHGSAVNISAPLAITGATATAPTPATTNNSTSVATTAFVKANLPVKVSVQSSAPSSPATNDVWIDTT